MSVQIRPMLEGDLLGILEIQQACYAKEKIESKEAFRQKLRVSPSTCFVVVHEHALAGYLVAIPRKLNELPSLDSSRLEKVSEPDCLYLHDLAVSPEKHGLGVGAALVKSFFQVMGKLGVQYASLVAVQNAESYWARFGFEPDLPKGASKKALLSYGQGSCLMLYRAVK